MFDDYRTVSAMAPAYSASAMAEYQRWMFMGQYKFIMLGTERTPDIIAVQWKEAEPVLKEMTPELAEAIHWMIRGMRSDKV